MKRIKNGVLILVFILASSVWAVGQSMYGDKVLYDVKMTYVNTLEEAMERAKEEKKMIFFNCFADWAIPCHGMNKHVFSDADFADYMNKTFVNLLIDVSKRENAYIAEKYKIDFFAHFLILDGDGNVIHRIKGGKKLPEFKEMIQKSLSPKTSLVGMNKIYADGNRNREFLRNYAKVLIAAGDAKADSVINIYISKTKKTELVKKENWFIVNRLSDGVGSEWFQFVIDNKTAFAKNNGLEGIDNFISIGYSMTLLTYVTDNKSYTADKINEIANVLTKAQISKDNKVYLFLELAKVRGEKRYADFIQILKARGSEIDGVIVDRVEFSVANMLDANPEEMKLIMAYLNDKEANSEGSLKKQYQSAIASMSSQNGIKFEDGALAEALKKAKATNKLLFLDAYTSWCGPCQTMARQVFTIEYIGEYFDKNFVAIKIDMEKGEGIDLAKKYNISSYPTMLLLDGDGKEMHRILGACSPAEFVRKLDVGLNPETCLTNVKAKYEAGDRTPLLVCNYIQAMEIAGEMKNGKTKAEEFFFTLPKIDQINATMKPLFQIYANKPNDRLTTFLMNNKAAYSKVIEPAELDLLVERIFFPELLGNIRNPEAINELKALIAQLDNAKVGDNSVIGTFVRMTKLHLQNNVDGIIDIYKKDVAKMDANPQGKLNLDLLTPIFMKEATTQQQQTMKDYIKEQSQKADSRAKSGYTKLMTTFE